MVKSLLRTKYGTTKLKMVIHEHRILLSYHLISWLSNDRNASFKHSLDIYPASSITTIGIRTPFLTMNPTNDNAESRQVGCDFSTPPKF